jgi:hypothetical protein
MHAMLDSDNGAIFTPMIMSNAELSLDMTFFFLENHAIFQRRRDDLFTQSSMEPKKQTVKDSIFPANVGES